MYKKLFLGPIVFVSGCAMMVLEILGSRILAPYVGLAIAAWTAVIGVMLLAIAAGYYIGGKYADKKRDKKVLSMILILAAVTVAAVVLTKGQVGSIRNFLFWDITFLYGLRAVIGSVLLLALPTMFLGAVTTYAIRLGTKSVDEVGESNGFLYGMSTAGSVVGIFGSSFFLVPFFTLSRVLLGTAVALAVTALAVFIFLPSKRAD